MARCFAVLWIPTVNHVRINFDYPYNNGIKKQNISDNPEVKFLVQIRTLDKDIEISISSEENAERLDYFLTLHYEDSSHNGMVKYSYDAKYLDNSEFCFDEYNFPEAIYHLIKGLYHQHEFHEDESDSSIKPYTSSTDIDIHEVDNPALNHYLENHERAILNLVKNAQNLLRQVVEKEKQSGRPNKLKEYESFPSMYVMALGYDAYIRALYESIYNTGCRTNNPNKEMRRRAFNIENSIRYFKVLYAFFDTKIRQVNNLAILQRAERNLTVSVQSLNAAKANIDETRKSAKSSTRWAFWSITISFILGIGSIVYSAITSRHSSQELEQAKSELLNTLQEIKASEMNVLDNSDSPNITTDSLQSPQLSVPKNPKGEDEMNIGLTEGREK